MAIVFSQRPNYIMDAKKDRAEIRGLTKNPYASKSLVWDRNTFESDDVAEDFQRVAAKKPSLHVDIKRSPGLDESDDLDLKALDLFVEEFDVFMSTDHSVSGIGFARTSSVEASSRAPSRMTVITKSTPLENNFVQEGLAKIESRASASIKMRSGTLSSVGSALLFSPAFSTSPDRSDSSIEELPVFSISDVAVDVSTSKPQPYVRKKDHDVSGVVLSEKEQRRQSRQTMFMKTGTSSLGHRTQDLDYAPFTPKQS